MSNSNSPSGGGVGFVGLLQVAFIVLKLTGYIRWSWWWVLSPSLISAGIIVLFLAFLLFLAAKEGRSAKGGRLGR